jgi:hypothetical protein
MLGDGVCFGTIEALVNGVGGGDGGDLSFVLEVLENGGEAVVLDSG